MKALIKKGKVLHYTCDAKDNCTVLYELRVKGLKKKVDACYR